MKKLHNIYATVKDIILYTDTRVSVLLCGISYIYWAVIFYLPQQVIDRPYYTGLSMISTNENLWGTVFLFLGICKLYNLFIYENDKNSKKTMFFNYFVRICCCSLTTYIFFTSGLNLLPPVAGDTLVVCLLSWWDFLRFDEVSYRKLYYKELIKRDK